MNLTNQALIQELEKRIRTRQITLARELDQIKQCAWSIHQDQFILKDSSYQLNLTALLEELETAKSKSCNCSQGHSKDFFTFLFNHLKPH